MNRLNHKKMNPIQPALILTWLAFSTISFQAAAADLDGEKLAQERRCYACHNMEDNLLGPPYRSIALRHAGRKDVMVEVLAEKIIVGGAGNWGLVPMVPNEHVSRDEARAIAKWILNLKKK